jgi:hypothetical protein
LIQQKINKLWLQKRRRLKSLLKRKQLLRKRKDS